MVQCIQPKVGETIADPSCGTGGFFLGALEYLDMPHQEKRQRDIISKETFHGRGQACLEYAEREQNARSEKFFNVSEYCNLTREEKAMYDVELKRKWDRANILAHAREQGLAEGKAEGEAKGKAEGKAEVVHNLLEAKRFSVEEIAKYANVPVSFVHEVQEKLSKTKK